MGGCVGEWALGGCQGGRRGSAWSGSLSCESASACWLGPSPLPAPLTPHPTHPPPPPAARSPPLRMAAAARASVGVMMAANSAPCTHDQPREANPMTKRMTNDDGGGGEQGGDGGGACVNGFVAGGGEAVGSAWRQGGGGHSTWLGTHAPCPPPRTNTHTSPPPPPNTHRRARSHGVRVMAVRATMTNDSSSTCRVSFENMKKSIRIAESTSRGGRN